MSYTNKQKLFAIYMLRRLGITEENKITKYLADLNAIYSRRYQTYTGKWYWSSDGCIQLLKDEIDLKKEKENIQKYSYDQKSIFATDLSSYIFCPVSYVINKSFKIDHPINSEEIQIGENYHSLLLAAKKHYSKSSETDLINIEIYNNAILDEVKKCTLLYSGHTGKKPFYVESENFTGDPDYIFLNSKNQKFIVEEKFTYKRDPNKSTWDENSASYHNNYFIDEEVEEQRRKWKYNKSYFFKNHIIQLYSYIRNHPEDISFGYLFYWFYDFKDGEIYIHKLDIKKIEKNDEYEELYNETKTAINELKTNRFLKSDKIEINYNKCVKCSVSKYCGHKNEKPRDLSYPYDLTYLELFPAVFPDDLKNHS